MGKKSSDYNRVIALLQRLKKDYPSYTMGQHIATAMSEYGDLWGVIDKEFLFALTKYKMEMESNTVSDSEIDRVVYEGQHLDELFKEEEEDYE